MGVLIEKEKGRRRRKKTTAHTRCHFVYEPCLFQFVVYIQKIFMFNLISIPNKNE